MNLKGTQFLWVEKEGDICEHYEITEQKPKIATVQHGETLPLTLECLDLLMKKYPDEDAFIVVPASEALKWRAKFESKNHKEDK